MKPSQDRDSSSRTWQERSGSARTPLSLPQGRLNARHHIKKILALLEIYGSEKITRAIQCAHEYHAYSCEYVANILEPVYCDHRFLPLSS